VRSFYEELLKKCEYGPSGDGFRSIYMEGALDAKDIYFAKISEIELSLKKSCTCEVVDDWIPVGTCPVCAAILSLKEF